MYGCMGCQRSFGTCCEDPGRIGGRAWGSHLTTSPHNLSHHFLLIYTHSSPIYAIQPSHPLNSKEEQAHVSADNPRDVACERGSACASASFSRNLQNGVAQSMEDPKRTLQYDTRRDSILERCEISLSTRTVTPPRISIPS